MPNKPPDLPILEERMLAVQTHYEAIAQPFEWKFTRDDLQDLLARLSRYDCPRYQAAA